MVVVVMVVVVMVKVVVVVMAVAFFLACEDLGKILGIIPCLRFSFFLSFF